MNELLVLLLLSPQLQNVILILFSILFQIQLINILTAVILMNCAIELCN